VAWPEEAELREAEQREGGAEEGLPSASFTQVSVSSNLYVDSVTILDSAVHHNAVTVKTFQISAKERFRRGHRTIRLDNIGAHRTMLQSNVLWGLRLFSSFPFGIF
jgi:hypothetical protein